MPVVHRRSCTRKDLAYPVLIGGAAINRAFSYRALYPGGIGPRTSLHEQFGHGYAQIRQFRWVFVRTLHQVKVVYPA